MQADRSLRSVFVGNIPYDATEEKLRDIFSAVGPVISFRIVFDRETGKPKGYGFCEYKDQETATSAIRNLNGHDLGGRQLRVDSAINERARDEPDATPANIDTQLQQQQIQHQPVAAPEPLVDAPTAINNVLCSLQPEQLFDICRQLKSSLLINPNETRQLLMQNPQLSYALLESLVMIKAIDAQTAMNTLHKQLLQPVPLQPPTLQTPMPMMAPIVSGLPVPAMPIQVLPQMNMPIINPTPGGAAPADPRLARQQQQHQQQQHQQQQQQQQHQQLQQQQHQQQQQQQESQLLMSEQERQALILQVVNMSDQEIIKLPPDQQGKIYQLRRQYLQGNS